MDGWLLMLGKTERKMDMSVEDAVNLDFVLELVGSSDLWVHPDFRTTCKGGICKI